MKNISLLTISVLTFGQFSFAGTWGAAELLEAQKASVEHFKEKMGTTLFNEILGFTIDLNAQKIAANAKIRYMENGAEKSVGYFCHTHGSEIDCH